MCVICISGKGEKMAKEQFENCWKSNSMGAGFAWRKNGLVHYEKGFMKLKGAWSFYRDMENVPHVAHFRITTSGGTCPELTHPFPVCKNVQNNAEGVSKKSVLFHNGIIGGWEGEFIKLIADEKIRIKDSKWNDTRYAALLASYRGNEIIGKLAGKFAMVKVDGITYWGDFTKVGDLLFSNSSYERRRWTMGTNGVWWNEKFESHSEVAKTTYYNDAHPSGISNYEKLEHERVAKKKAVLTLSSEGLMNRKISGGHDD